MAAGCGLGDVLSVMTHVLSVMTQRKVNVSKFQLITRTTSKFVELNEEKHVKEVKRKLGYAVACS